jgi:signal transduction histidine kinase
MPPLFCSDSTPSFLAFFDLSIAPSLLFYTYFPVIIIALIFGFTIFRKNRKNLLNRLLFLINLFFGLWVIDVFVLWIAAYNDAIMFGWQITPALEILLFVSAIYFTYVFTDRNHSDITNRLKLVFLGIITAVFLLLPTELNTFGYDINNCEAVLGLLWTALYTFEILTLGWIAVICLHRYKKIHPKDPFRKQIKYLATGILSFLFLFLASNVAGEALGLQQISFVGSLGMALFLGLLVLMIVKFKTFNIKLLATQALVWSLWIMIGAILFVAQTDTTRIVTAATEVLAIAFGIMLIKSVKREVMQREQLQKLTSELAAKNQKLQELDVQKSQFLSFASHDLKSPVNVIKQFASLILDKTYSTPEKIMETAQKIKNNAERAVGLVDDFLDLRRLEDGKMEYSFEKKNLVALIHDITEDFKVLAKQQKNIDVVFTTTRNEIFANLDVSRFSQVIQNLLSNSLKYTESGTITVRVNDEQATALIEVHDTGMGMSAELIPTLFEQFHRAPGVAKKIQGTGLGLYIAKQIVLGHSGEMWAASEGPGKGSSFFVRVRKAQ